MKIVMVHQIVKKNNPIKVLDCSWHLKKTLVRLKDNFMDALEENDFLEEINQLKICLEENKFP